MKFRLDKCAVLEMKRGERVECEGIELPSDEMVKEVDEDGYKHLGILEGPRILQKIKESKWDDGVSPLCRVCGVGSESVWHVACGCKVLAQKEYKRRHDMMELRVY